MRSVEFLQEKIVESSRPKRMINPAESPEQLQDKLRHRVQSVRKRKDDQLVNFYFVQENLERVTHHRLGIQTIPIDRIVGSLDRYEDFSKGFGLNNEEAVNDRFKSVKYALESGKILPPIRVYQVSDKYFVIDGHHRVAVAKNVLEAKDVDAEVIQINFDLTLSSDKKYRHLTEQTYDFLLHLEEYIFQEKTFLRNKILRHPLKVTELTSYAKLYEEIVDYQKKVKLDDRRKKLLIEASYEWYETRFLPAIDIILNENILDRFPHRTYTDLYVWIQIHKYYLSLKSGRDIGFAQTQIDFVKKFGKPKFLDVVPELFEDIMGVLKKTIEVIEP